MGGDNRPLIIQPIGESMKIKVELDKDSSFNDELHFFHCLEDLIDEWNESEFYGPKEMDEQDAGFNSDRLEELYTFLKKQR